MNLNREYRIIENSSKIMHRGGPKALIANITWFYWELLKIMHRGGPKPLFANVAWFYWELRKIMHEVDSQKNRRTTTQWFMVDTTKQPFLFDFLTGGPQLEGTLTRTDLPDSGNLKQPWIAVTRTNLKCPSCRRVPGMPAPRRAGAYDRDNPSRPTTWTLAAPTGTVTVETARRAVQLGQQHWRQWFKFMVGH